MVAASRPLTLAASWSNPRSTAGWLAGQASSPVTSRASFRRQLRCSSRRACRRARADARPRDHRWLGVPHGPRRQRDRRREETELGRALDAMAAHRPGRSRRARRPAGRPAGELRGGPPQHRRRADRLSGPDPDQPRDSRWIVQAESDIAAGHDRCPRPARAAFAGPGLARRRPQLLDAPDRAGGDGKQLGLPRIYIHAFTDGRDEPPTSAAGFVEHLVAQLKRIGSGRIASVSGRYFAMDRDKRWDRTELAYRTVVEATGPTAPDPVAFIRQSYDAGTTDEFLKPTRIVPPGGEPVPAMGDGDSVIFFNFRPDRARQLSHAILDASWDPFPRAHRPALAHFVTLTAYDKGLTAEIAFPDEPLRGVLAEVISRAGWSQFHTAETEKYAHVTYFLNGGREAPFAGEDRLLVPSPTVATYDLQPAMSARPVTDVLLDRLAGGRYRFLVVK